ncbi:MAG: hypothetical protein ABI472_14595 [Ginsengibacter sp.]
MPNSRGAITSRNDVLELLIAQFKANRFPNSIKIWKTNVIMHIQLHIKYFAFEGGIINCLRLNSSYHDAGNDNEYAKPRAVNNKEQISTGNNHTPEIELGKILNDFFEEIERANYLGDGRRKKRSTRTRWGI